MIDLLFTVHFLTVASSYSLSISLTILMFFSSPDITHFIFRIIIKLLVANIFSICLLILSFDFMIHKKFCLYLV